MILSYRLILYTLINLGLYYVPHKLLDGGDKNNRATNKLSHWGKRR